MVPKVNHPGDIHFVSRLLDGIQLNKGYPARIGIEASIESARGLENVSKTARASDRLRTLVFGIADYSASVGARLGNSSSWKDSVRVDIQSKPPSLVSGASARSRCVGRTTSPGSSWLTIQTSK